MAANVTYIHECPGTTRQLRLYVEEGADPEITLSALDGHFDPIRSQQYRCTLTDLKALLAHVGLVISETRRPRREV